MECVTSQAQQQASYDDFVVVQEPPAGGDAPAWPARHWGIWLLVKGHGGGADAARDAARLFPEELARRMPAAPLRASAARDAPETVEYASRVRCAAAAAFLAASAAASANGRRAAARAALAGGAAALAPLPAESEQGATATLAVLTGRLLTVANVGALRAVLDAVAAAGGGGGGRARVELTRDHRIGGDEDEDERLAAAGAEVARLRPDLSGPAAPGGDGVGPPRVWPGGHRYSRSLGGGGGPDSSPAVIPYPVIRQVWLPDRPCRLILATEAVWDGFDTWHKAAALIQAVSAPNAAPALLQRPPKSPRRAADRSAIVVDFVPAAGAAAAPRRPGSRGGGRDGGKGAFEDSGSSFKNMVRLERLSRRAGASSGGGSSGGGAPWRGAGAAAPRAAGAGGRGGTPGGGACGHGASWPSGGGGLPRRPSSKSLAGASDCSPVVSLGAGTAGPSFVSGMLTAGSPRGAAPPPAGWRAAAAALLRRRSAGGASDGDGGGGAAAAAQYHAGPKRRRVAALLSRLLPACFAPGPAAPPPPPPASSGGSVRGAAAAHPLLRRSHATGGDCGASAASVCGSSVRGGAHFSMTVARVDAFEAYAGGRYGRADLVLAALDARLRAAAAASAAADVAAAAAEGPGGAAAAAAAAAAQRERAPARSSSAGPVLSSSLPDAAHGLSAGGESPTNNPMLRASIALTD